MSLAWYRHLTTSVAAVPPMIDIQYIYKRRNNSILNPPFPHFVLLLLFFSSPSLHTRPFRDHQRVSFSMPVCAQAYLSEHTHSWRYTLSFMCFDDDEDDTLSFSFLPAAFFQKLEKDVASVLPSFLFLSSWVQDRRKKESRKRYRETKPQKTIIITLCVCTNSEQTKKGSSSARPEYMTEDKKEKTSPKTWHVGIQHK